MGHYHGRDQLRKRRNMARRSELRLFRESLANAGIDLSSRPTFRCHRCKLEIPPTSERIGLWRGGKIHHYRCLRCHVALDLLEYKKSGRLTMQLLLEARYGSFYFAAENVKSRWRKPLLLEKYSARVNANEETIHAAVKRFERERWYNGGVQQAINATDAPVINGETTTLLIRTFTCAGRTMITMERRADGDSVTVITCPDEAVGSRVEWGGSPDVGPMGIKGVDCSAATAVEILESAISEWPEALMPGTAIYAGIRVGG